MSNSDIEQAGTVKGHIPNGASLSGRISNVVSLSGHISIGSGSSDFIIKMTVEVNGDNYTVTSCDKTMEQIDAAVAAEKRVVLIATDTTSGGFWEMSLVQAFHGETYIFMAYTFSGYVMSTVYKYGENETWEFVESGISSEYIDYYDSTQQTVINVKAALDNLVPKSHTHTNKAVLDKFAETDGKPTYNGEKISGASTAEEVEYTNAILPDASNVKSALDYTIDTLQTQSADTESLRAGVSALIDAYETQGGDIASLKTQAHTHANKDTLDKLSDSNGNLTYNGEPIGGENTIYIPATLNFSDDGTITVETSATFEQIDTAYKSGQEQILKVGMDDSDTDGYLMSITIASPGNFYYFVTFYGEHSMLVTVMPPDEWTFVMYNLIDHTHDNKPVLDKLSVTGGKLQYNGSYVGLKPSQVTSGTSITLADNTEYRLTDVTELTITYPNGNFECWIRLDFAEEGIITVTLPAKTQYIGTTPTFDNGETWELSIKDGIVIAGKVS